MSLSKKKIVIGLCSTAIIVCATLTGLNHSVNTEQGRGNKMIEYANALGTESTTTTEETTVSTTTTTTKETTTSTTKSTTTKPTTTTTAKSTTTTTLATSTETTVNATEIMVNYENAPVPEAVYTDFTEVAPQVEPDVEIVDEPEPADTEPTETNTETEPEVVVTEPETEEASTEPEIETEIETEPETEPVKNICPVTGYELLYSATYNVTSNPLTKSMGVVQNFNGHRETWYSERVLPGYGLKIPGRHCGDDGTVRDENGYICVASDLSYLPRGSIVLTTRGPGKVYDTGCAYGTIDIYVNW